MIKATELRLGNIVGAGVLFNDDGDEIGPMPSLVKEIDSYEIKWTRRLNEPLGEYGSDSTSLECVVGIPLTEEWLIKFGFTDIGSSIKYNGLRLSFGFYRVYPAEKGIEIQFDTPFGDRQINTVHQLQNWFHALTGEELTIKETA